MERRTALLGSRTGQWIRTSGRRLTLDARVSSDTMLKVEQANGDAIDETRSQVLVGPGKRLLDPASWTRVSVVDGSYLDAMCFLETA